MQNLIGWSEVSAALIFSFGFGLLLECLLLKYLMHVVARQVQPEAPLAEAREFESGLPVDDIKLALIEDQSPQRLKRPRQDSMRQKTADSARLPRLRLRSALGITK